jgi:single-strand DNA-binding protein
MITKHKSRHDGPKAGQGAGRPSGAVEHDPAHPSGTDGDAGMDPLERPTRGEAAGTRSAGQPARGRGTERIAGAKARGGPHQAGRTVHDDPPSRDSGADGIAGKDRDAGVDQEKSPLAGAGHPDRNEVALTGRLSAEPTERVLRTGNRLTSFRLIVRRPITAPPPVIGAAGEDVPKAVRRSTVDVVECAVWDADLASALAGLVPGDRVAVRGALRRRFASSGGRPMSWFTVEVAAIEPVDDEQSGRLAAPIRSASG